ncbi:MAG: hypothetical protein QM757_21135 [Paludibaculum sp.]
MSIRPRVLFPLINAAIDVVLLIATAYAVHEYLSTLRRPKPLWDQQYEHVDRQFLRDSDGPWMPNPLQAINFGTLPATIAAAGIAEVIFANGALSWKVSSPFDARLAGLTLCLALLFWYAAGCWLERVGPKWSYLAWWYVLLRVVTVPASVILRGNGAWMFVVLLFCFGWMSLTAALMWKGALLVLRRYRTTATLPPTGLH